MPVMVVILFGHGWVTREEMVDRADRHALHDSAMEASLCHHGTLVSVLILVILAFDLKVNA